MRRRQKVFLILCGLTIALITNWSCSDEELQTGSSSGIPLENDSEKWLDETANFEADPAAYKKYFWMYYDSVKSEPEKWKKALAIYGSVLMDNYAADSLLASTLSARLSTEDEKADSLWILLHFYATDQYYSLGDYQKLKITGLKGLSYCELPKYEYLKVGFENFIGLGYSDRGKPDSAIGYFLDAIQLAEKNKFHRKLGSVYNNLAYAYDMLYASNESGKMYRKAADNFLLAKDTTNYFALLSTYAINQLAFSKDTLLTLNLFDSAFVQLNKTKPLNPFETSIANEILAYKYYYLGDYDLAKQFNDKCLLYRLEVGTEDYLITYSYIFDSAIYFKKYGKLKDPLKTMEWAAEMKENKQYYDALELYDQLYAYEKKKGDYEKANHYLLISNALNDSLRINNQRGQLFELEKKYETQKKEQEIELQKNELRRKNLYIGLLSAAVVVLLMAVVLYQFWQKQKTLNQEKMNSMNFTKQLLQTTEEERKRIAGDLHDSISHELLDLKQIFSKDIAEVNGKIDQIINEIRGISRNLHPVMFDKTGLVSNLEQLVERIQNQNDFFVSLEMNYQGSLSSADELQIYRIIQESLTNILKYAKAHAARISIQEDVHQIDIEIKDNGVGFQVKEVLNSGKAFGLHNILQRSQVVGGEATIDSNSSGTTIRIRIPKYRA